MAGIRILLTALLMALTGAAALAGPTLERMTAPERRTAPEMVPVRFHMPAAAGDAAAGWSAVPLGQGMQPEAWATVDSLAVGEAVLEPGPYLVEAVLDDGRRFASLVTVTSGMAEDVMLSTVAVADALVTCDRPAGCGYRDPQTGLVVTLPGGWSVDQPVFYETAGGHVADLPTTRFTWPADGGEGAAGGAPAGIVIALNPRQWQAASGPCVETAAGSLCRPATDDAVVPAAMAVLVETLTIDSVLD